MTKMKICEEKQIKAYQKFKIKIRVLTPAIEPAWPNNPFKVK